MKDLLGCFLVVREVLSIVFFENPLEIEKLELIIKRYNFNPLCCIGTGHG